MTAREILIARYRAVDVKEPEAYADATLAEMGMSGLVVVAEVATDAQIDAGRRHCRDDQSNYGDAQARAIWDAMIRAATKP